MHGQRKAFMREATALQSAVKVSNGMTEFLIAWHRIGTARLSGADLGNGNVYHHIDKRWQGLTKICTGMAMAVLYHAWRCVGRARHSKAEALHTTTASGKTKALLS